VSTIPYSFTPDISFFTTRVAVCINPLPCDGHKRLIIQMAGNIPSPLQPCCFHNSLVNSKRMSLITLVLFYERHLNKKLIPLANILVSKTKYVFGALENVCMYVNTCLQRILHFEIRSQRWMYMHLAYFVLIYVLHKRYVRASDFQIWLIYRHYQRLISLVGDKV
jgi:hypothetical protein